VKATEILIGISAGTREQARTIISAGGIPLIAEILRKGLPSNWVLGNHRIYLNLVCSVENLAIDGKEFCKVLVVHGIKDILVLTLSFPS